MVAKDSVESQKLNNLLTGIINPETAFRQGGQPFEPSCEKLVDADKKTHDRQKTKRKSHSDTEGFIRQRRPRR